jgi:hypothetical protein
MLHGRSELTTEDWAWINRYLFLADKAFQDAKAASEQPTLSEQLESLLGKKTG